MKLFSKEINLKLFKQYPKGGDLKNQVVVTKIFNPYSKGRWYLINSDPDDPDYIWAIVQMGSIVEVGSVSRKQLESIRIKPFNLPLERDLYFDPVNAAELFKGLSEGKFYKAGGWTEGGENKAMLLNQAEGFEHHAEELEKAVKASDHVPAWVVAKSERASTDLSDITHYLDGENEQKREMIEGEEEEEYSHGGEVKWQEAEYGDNALVVSENKMGIIIKPYGRKFHLRFVDGTEKTYDANDLKFFKDMDDFDRGGETAYGGMMAKGGKIVGYEVEYEKLVDGESERDIKSFKNKEDAEKFAKENYSYVENVYEGQYTMAEGGMMEGGGETDKKITFKRGDYFIVLKDMGKLKRFRIWKIDGNSVTINYSRYDGTDVYDSNETKSNLKYLLENGYIKKVNKTTYWNRKYENYADGGKVKFKDKVASIKASLLKRKKVPKAVQKDYGKTFSPAEAEDSAKRIAGAMTAKERLQARLKKRKK